MKIVYRSGDNHERRIIRASLMDNQLPKDQVPASLGKFLETDKNTQGVMMKFEVEVAKDEVVKNVLNKYLIQLDDEDFVTTVQLDEELAGSFSEKPHSLSLFLYGTTKMYYTIMMLNNINHPAELSRNLLVNTGIKVFNSNGIKKLSELAGFIRRKNAIDGEGFMGE
ncbi:MAG: hypothetical protein ACRC92_27115 [Peptostreptococcaceae bacterium]